MASKKEVDDFIKKQCIQGNIKNASEAFEEYPVENEWHKGKIENILREGKVSYSPYNIGDIVFVEKFSYSDGSDGYNHLFVIIAKDDKSIINNIAVPIENVGMLISSQLEKLKYSSNKLLKKNEENGLDKDSIVKTDEVYNIINTQILFKVGSVDLRIIEAYKLAYYNNKKNK